MCLSGFGALCAVHKKGKGTVVAPKGMVMLFPLYEGQQQGGSGSVWKSCDDLGRKPSGSSG
jgi:hypothetical protein